MGRRAAAVAGFVVLAIVGAGCADDGEASGAGSTTTTSTTTSPTTTSPTTTTPPTTIATTTTTAVAACADAVLGHGASPADAIGEADLDGDGFVDRLYAWSSSGSGAGTLALVIGGGTTNTVFFPDWDERPELLATHDFEGDGTAELLVSVPGEDHTAVALRLDGCRLEKLPRPHELPLTDPNDRSVGEFRFDVSPSACEFEGCGARASCLDEELVVEVTYFLDHRNPHFDPEDPEFTWLINRYRIEAGQWVDTHPDGRGDPTDVQPPPFEETGGGLFC